MKWPIFLLLQLHLVPIWAQPEIQWQKTYGGYLYDEVQTLKITPDLGFIACGLSMSPDGDVFGNHGVADFWIVKMDTNGAIKWQKSLGGSFNDIPLGFQLTPDGGSIAVGMTESSDGDVSGNHGLTDGWVVKLDSLGMIEWQRSLGGSSYEEFWGVDVCKDGSYIVAGGANSIDGDVSGIPGNYMDFWVIKLSSKGEIIWQRTLGGTHDDKAHYVFQTNDGGFLLTGETQSVDGDVFGNNGNVDFWVVKLDSVGRLEWQHPLGGQGWDVGVKAYEFVDGYWVLGYIGSNNGDIDNNHGLFDYWLAKLDKTGTIIWQSCFGGSDGDWARDGIPLDDGGFLMIGETRSTDGDVLDNDGGQDAWLLKIDSIGEIAFRKCYGGSKAETGKAICRTPDGGFAFAGYSKSTDQGVPQNEGLSDFWIVKLAPEPTSTAATPIIEPLQVSPNPGSDRISVRLPGRHASEITWRFYDAMGRVVLSAPATNQESIDTSPLPKGWYLITAIAGDGVRYGAPWVKK